MSLERNLLTELGNLPHPELRLPKSHKSYPAHEQARRQTLYMWDQRLQPQRLYTLQLQLDAGQWSRSWGRLERSSSRMSLRPGRQFHSSMGREREPVGRAGTLHWNCDRLQQGGSANLPNRTLQPVERNETTWGQENYQIWLQVAR